VKTKLEVITSTTEPSPLQKLYGTPEFQREWAKLKDRETKEESYQHGHSDGWHLGLAEGERRGRRKERRSIRGFLISKWGLNFIKSGVGTVRPSILYDDLRDWLAARSKRASRRMKGKQ